MSSTSKQTQRSRNRRSAAPTAGKGAKSTIQCVCGSKREFGMMIQCEECLSWQHGPCVGLSKEEDCPQQYYCEQCRPELHSSSSRHGSYPPSKKVESRRNLDTGKRECRPNRNHPYQSGSSRGLLSRGTPPHSDLVASSAPAPPCSSTISSTSPNATSTVESLDADATRMDYLERDEVLRLLGGVEKSTEEGPGTRKRVQSGRTGNRASRIENRLASEPGVKPKAPAGRTSTEPDKPYVYRGSRIGKMLALSTYAQAVLPEESKRLLTLEAFIARASEVGLTDRPGEFDGQLVREITGLREVTDPTGFDPETKKTLDLAEELSRDLLAFREKYGAGNSFVPTGRRERTAREAAAAARQRMTGESDKED